MRSQANDVLIPCSGETAEDIATARCVKMEGILLGGDLNIMRFDKQDGAFMSYQLNGKRKYDIARVAQGVSVVHLYPEHLKSIKVVLPELEEQQKIVNLLSLIDERMKYFRDYSFDAEAIIYAGEGAEFLPRYYNGKFALHQRCYAITTFSSDFYRVISITIYKPRITILSVMR